MPELFKYTEISQLVNNHYIFALIFHLYQVNVFDHGEKTLEELCLEKEIPLEQVKGYFEDLSIAPQKGLINLDKIPLEVVVDFTKDQHQIFRQNRLPFLRSLIEKLKAKNAFLLEVKERFPKFEAGLVEHMKHEEEITLPQMVYLVRQKSELDDLFEAYSVLNSFSMEEALMLHRNDERDELFDIMELTTNYMQVYHDDIQIKVLVKELESFNRQLHIHSCIENEVLFPVAIRLERSIYEELKKGAILN